MRTLSNEIVDLEEKDVELFGWVRRRRDHGKIIFIDLQDRSGTSQIVFLPSQKEARDRAEFLRPEWVVKIKGTVVKRPPAMVNEKIASGAYEVHASSLEVLSESRTPPFEIADENKDIGEEVRMKYRYLDLRTERMQSNIRMRARATKFMRDFLTDRGFLEIETPILGKSTPEGARDYLVPSRAHPGKFYALPQSPQQYKQLLMVAGFERYFQVARCFRDEDTRGDRQPEFTQLDIEMSFTDRDEVLSLIEELYLSLVRTVYPRKKLMLDTNGKIPRISYKDAMEKYDSDKPDARMDKNDPDELAFLFIVDFPMFEWKKSEKRWDAVHHPFTMPQVGGVEEFKKKFKENPASILSYQYDFIINGYEVGGGSIRIHDPDLLLAVFEAMGNSPESVREKFGHMLESFTYGVPPHGGIAPGIDRLMMILQNEPNIREVIAFPKTGDGRDLLTDAPSRVDKSQLKELKIQTEK